MCASRHPRLSTTLSMPNVSELWCVGLRTLACGPKDTPSLNITALLLYIQNTVAYCATNLAHLVYRCMPPNDAHTDQSRRKMGASVSVETERNTLTPPPPNYLEERLLDQAQARALYAPPFGGVIRVAYTKA